MTFGVLPSIFENLEMNLFLKIENLFILENKLNAIESAHKQVFQSERKCLLTHENKLLRLFSLILFLCSNLRLEADRVNFNHLFLFRILIL